MTTIEERAARPHPRASRGRRRLPAIVVALLLTVPVVIAASVYEAIQLGRSPAGPASPPGGIVSATVSQGAYVGTHYANPFYAVVFTADNTPSPMLAKVGSFLNSTPITWFRFGGNGSGYDPTTGIDYAPPAGGGTYVGTPDLVWNLTWFKGWCQSRVPSCLWLGYLPAEENNTTLAVHVAEWYHTQLGFAPQLWQLGNEPSGWTHFGLNVTGWSTSDDSTVSPSAYAGMARAYVAAIRGIYPLDRFVGIEAACACDQNEASATASAVGAEVAAMAFHTYPSTSASSTSLGGFYAALDSATNLSSQTERFASAVQSACATCPSLPLQIGEYQSGPLPTFSPFAATYAGAPFLAASVIQAITANVSTFTVFNSGALFNPTRGAPTFEGLLYQRLLANLTMGADYAAPIPTPGVTGVYSLLVHNGSRSALLVVNTNLSYALDLSVPSTIFPTAMTGSEWSWGPGQAVPTANRSIVLPGAYTIPPQGILLVANY